MEKFIILFIVLFLTSLQAEDKYNPFITQQIEYVKQTNDVNITKDKIRNILQEQARNYESALEHIMGDKNKYIHNLNEYNSALFTLEKIIKINKRSGHGYAVLRDEVQQKTYRLLQNQNKMISNVLSALDYSDSKEFNKELNAYVVKNQLANQTLQTVDYQYILDSTEKGKVFAQLQNNVREYYSVTEINADVINYLYKFEKQMYRLNKYSKYNLIGIVLSINHMNIVQKVNPVLEAYGLNIVKIIIILTLIIVIYLIRKVFYVGLEAYLININFLKKYTKDILNSVRKTIEYLIVIMNINMIVYVYNDFTSMEFSAQIFNIIYVILITIIVYKIINVVASIKVHEIDRTTKKVKHEIINLSIKIVNFIVMVIGLLFVLHFAGANLTAVLSGLGIGGFAVALAAKDSLANFFGTLSILLSDVFSQGDWIVIDGNEGVVVEIGLRVTTIRTFDNALIAIPNAILANQDVKNWNKRELGRRIKMSLGVKYTSSSQDIKNAVDEIRAMLDQHPQIATENTQYQYNMIRSAKLVSEDDSHGIKKILMVYLDEFSDSSINILVYCFSKSVQWDEWLATKEDIMHQIMYILEKNNLEFAFPSMSLYHESSVPKVDDIN